MDKQRIARQLLAVAKEVTAVTSRRFFPGCEAEIASEVVENGKSEGWNTQERGDRTWKAAANAEKKLAKFNIGYIDDMFGEWGFSRGGSNFFS